MPPARIAALAREPRLTASLPSSEGRADRMLRKDTGGFGTNYAGGLGFGAWGFIPGSTGQAITPYGALQLPVAYACVKRIAADIGKLPREIRRKLSNGGTRVIRDHPRLAGAARQRLCRGDARGRRRAGRHQSGQQ
jgi:hypothetical protein